MISSAKIDRASTNGLNQAFKQYLVEIGWHRDDSIKMNHQAERNQGLTMKNVFQLGVFIRLSNQLSNRSTMFQTSSIMSKTVNQLALSLALCPTLIALNPAHSKPVICSPNNGSTKVLAKPSPTSPPAKGWGPGNSIGTAWQLVKNKEQTFGRTHYIQGKLLSPFSPRAGYSYEQYLAAKGQEVWGILSEWNCQ